jgi:hypothetical protein
MHVCGLTVKEHSGYLILETESSALVLQMTEFY